MVSPALFALAVVGCSLSTFHPTPCASNLDCRDAFGAGSVCGTEGLCQTATIPERCGTVWPETLTLPVPPETLVVATVFDHSLATHVGRYRSAQLAFSQANASGGLEGDSFAMVHCTNEEGTGIDDLTREEASVADATWLADQLGVPAIIGPAASGDVEAVYNAVADAYGTLLVSPSATSPSLTPLDGLASTDEDPGLLWRTAPPDDQQALAIAWDMRNNLTTYRLAPSDRVAVVYQEGAYGDGLQVTFTDAFLAAGGTSLPYPFDSELGPGDALATVANLSDVDEVLFVSSETADIVAFLLATKGLAGLDDKPLFLTDAARNVDVLNDAASAASLFPRIRGTAPANPTGPVYDSFAASYAAEYGGEDVSTLSYTAQSFDAAWLVAYGHAWAMSQEGSIEGLHVARGLRRVSEGPTTELRPTSWNEVKARFEAGDSVDVVGASGELDYDPITGETSAEVQIWTISGDTFPTVETYSP